MKVTLIMENRDIVLRIALNIVDQGCLPICSKVQFLFAYIQKFYFLLMFLNFYVLFLQQFHSNNFFSFKNNNLISKSPMFMQ